MDLHRFFRYDDWANGDFIAHLRALPEPPPAALRLLAHVLATQRIWLDVLGGREDSVPAWPEWDAGECARQLDALRAEWPREIDAPDRDVVEHVTAEGERYTRRASDILAHVLFHGAYHRGQIATVLRAGGGARPYTDYIHCARQGILDVR
jgi:uncharacterized damage-inducible protein DinB